MLRLSQEINIAEVLYPDEVGIASVASEMFCHFSLFTSSLFSRYSGQIDAKGKLQEPDKATSNHAYKMFQIIITLIAMPRKVSHKEATYGSFYEGSDKYKIAGSLTTL